MELLYNSDAYVVVQFDVPSDAGRPGRGGYEIVDKLARKEIFIEGRLAEHFEAGVRDIVAGSSRSGGDGPNVEALDDYIAGFTALAQQPVLMH
jgi:hypothetical protein